MATRFGFGALVLGLVGAGAVGGCSADEVEAPPAYAMGGGAGGGSGSTGANAVSADEAEELRALEVTDDEPIVDEGNVDDGRDGALEENPIAEDEEEVSAVEILSVLTPRAEARVAIGAKKYKCPQRNLARTCVCEGSPLNCELPNDQPGRNRYLPPSFLAEVKTRGAKIADVLDAGRWEVAPTAVLHDGEGKVRGTFRSTCMPWAGPTGPALAKDDTKVCAKINFGQFKNMRADGDTAMRTYVYAFNVFVNGVTDSSGWIRLDSVLDKAGVAKMRSATPRRIRSFVATKYVVKSAQDWGQDPATFAADKLPAWSLAKVAPGAGSKKVGDYLLRDGNVINLAYATPGVGGVATDTLSVAHEGLAFKRVKSTTKRPTLVRIPVDHPVKKGMVFAYGSVNDRFGWMALAAIKKGAADATPTEPPSVCDGKPDGTYCSEQFSLYGYTCKAGKVVASLTCPPPNTNCKGPSPDGKSLVCDL